MKAIFFVALFTTTLAFADDATPEALDRASIATAMKDVKPAVQACGTAHPTKGSVKVAVTVAPGGEITKIEIKATPEPALGNCVAKAVEKAKFPKTQKGGSFTYPFVF